MSELPKATFWMVYGVGQRSPTQRHDTVESATAEAKRLARAHQGTAFVILRAIGAVVKDDLKTVSFMEDWIADDQIPF